MQLTPSTDSTVDTAVRAVLERDERLLWSGQPDLRAMEKGRARLPGHLPAIVRVVVRVAALGAVAWVGLQLKAHLDAGLNAQAFVQENSVPIIATMILVFSLSRRDGDGFLSWANSLAYAVTDKRALVLENGAIVGDYSPQDIDRPVERPRRFSHGYVDLVWGREVRRGSEGSSSSSRRVDRRRIEEMRIGFKALTEADSASVQEHFKTLREDMLEESAEAARDFTENATNSLVDAEMSTFTNTGQGFRISCPASWNAEFRRRKLVFGKWGIESSPDWKPDPQAVPDWNVVRVSNDAGSSVELQVAETRQLLTLDKMLNGAIARMTGLAEAIDQDANVNINGLPGFSLTRRIRGTTDLVAEGDIVSDTEFHHRQYVLHDSRRQYYIHAIWPADAPRQKETCVAIAETLERT